MKRQVIDKNIGAFTKWLGVYFLCLPLGAMNIGSIGSALKILAFVPVFIWVIKSHKVRINYIILNSLAFILMCCLSVMWSINTEASVSRSISNITFFLMLMAASGYFYSVDEIDFLKKCLVWSSRLTALITLVFGGYLQGRLYLNGVISEDPNYLCAYFIFAVVLDITIMLSAGISKRKKFLSIFELAIYIFIILATGSRGGMFSVAAAAVIILFFYSDKQGAIGLTTLKKVLICSCIAVSLYLALSFLPEDIAVRFSASAIRESNGTGRYELWKDAISAFNNSPFLRKLAGYGTGTAINITYLFPFHRHNVMHNIFVENLIEIGCIGLFSYVLYIGSFIHCSLKNRDLYCFAVICGMVVMSFSTSLYTFKPYWNIMLFILCVYLQYDDDSNTESN